MNKNEILKWETVYNKEEELYNPGLEEELRTKFQKDKFVTKKDLEEIVKWKFQGRLKGRGKRILNLLNSVEDEFIQQVSKLAFQAEDDKIRLSLLTSIKVVGVALSSVILTFYDPKRYRIIDIHDWQEMFGKEPADLFTDYKHTLKFFAKLRKIADETGLTCRVIEKALFMKNLKDSRK
jgi:hypothetical protein